MPFPSPALVLPFYVLLKIGLGIRRWRVQAALEGIAQLCVDEALALRRPGVIDAGRHRALALPLAALTARRPTAAIPADLPKQDRVASVQGVARFANLATGASFERPAFVPTSAEFCFGMNAGTTPAPTVWPRAACRSPDSRRSASGPALSLS
jgi:hypothetical protein